MPPPHGTRTEPPTLERLVAAIREAAGRFDPSALPDYERRGLSAVAVRERIAAGAVNSVAAPYAKRFRDVVRDNVFTAFNFLNVVLAAAVLLVAVREPRYLPNLAFFLVAVLNTALAVVQEWRAQCTLQKLTLLTEPRASVIRDGRETEIQASDIVVDDLIRLASGHQVPVDALVLSGGGEVDESLQTGESDQIAKVRGDILLSGSLVVSGSLQARVVEVGERTLAARVAGEARRDQRDESVLFAQLDRLVRTIGQIILPLGALLVGRQLLYGRDMRLADIIVSTVGNLVSMIPEGLILLSSMAFAVSVIQLARRGMLTRQLASVENLARVDMLCLDKTGTITTGDMDVEVLIPLTADVKQAEILEALRLLAAGVTAPNATQLAINRWLAGQRAAEFTANGYGSIPFSSARKWAAVRNRAGEVWYQGAPRFLLGELPPELAATIAMYTQRGARVLLIARGGRLPTVEELRQAGPPPGPLEPLALLVLDDRLRDDAAATVRYFMEQGVLLRIISGDDPRTVAAIARRVGVAGAEKAVDMSALDEAPDYLELARRYTVFGRVSPFQKRRLIEALQELGHVVAMTGDGVNDVLAMSRANCAVAMAKGSEATRAAAHLVLLADGMGPMVDAVHEGRRVINNIRRVSTLFLVKTTYASLMAFLMLFIPLVYPLYPIQATLLSSLTVGLPGFVLALKPNRERVRGSFFGHVLPLALPAGITVTLSWILIQLVAHVQQLGYGVLSTLSLLAACLVGLLTLQRASRPFDFLRRLLFVFCASTLLLLLIFIPGLFHVHPLHLAPLPQLMPPLLGLTGLLYFIIRQQALLFPERKFLDFYARWTAWLRKQHRRLRRVDNGEMGPA